jgi:hypothetical protein
MPAPGGGRHGVPRGKSAEIGAEKPVLEDFSLLFYIWINLLAGLLQSCDKYRSIRARPGPGVPETENTRNKKQNLGSTL